MKTVTWFPATYTTHTALHSRMPAYIIPMHAVVNDVTELSLQEALVWFLDVWLTGRMPKLSHDHQPFSPKSIRHLMGSENQFIAGGHIGIYVGTVGDKQWVAEHFRFSSIWSAIEICLRCTVENRADPLDFAQPIDLPERLHSSDMTSRGAAISVLSRALSFHTSIIRGEAMHAGSVGALSDAIGSCVVRCATKVSLAVKPFRPGT